MSNINLRNITNHFQDVRLISLRSWRQAGEISPRDRGGPYVVLQEGYNPGDLKMIPTEFVLGRSGKWLPLAFFYRMSVPERRAEFVFGTVGEVMRMMADLPSKPSILGGEPETTSQPPANDEMAAAIQTGKEPGSEAG